MNRGKYLSYLLRYHPEEKNLIMLDEGLVNVNQLIDNTDFELNELKTIVKNDKKQRYSFKENYNYIRTNQGHSCKVNMNYEPKNPPNILYHGTNHKYWDNIKKQGLLPKTRQYVHLSTSIEVAKNVASRHDNQSIILEIDAKKMKDDKFTFCCSENKVWLTKNVPFKYIKTKSIH